MLQLPVTLRIAVAHRFFATATQRLSRLHSTQWTSPVTTQPQGILQQPASRGRLYATVHRDDLEHMWREHRNDSLRPSGGNIKEHLANLEVPARASTSDLMDLLKDHLTSLELSEARELIASLFAASERSTRRHTRQMERRRIRRAVSASNPLSSLKHLAASRSSSKQNRGASETLKAPSAGQPHDFGVDSTQSEDAVQVELLDVRFIQRTMRLPTRDQYPLAPNLLFDPRRISAAVEDQCRKKRVSQRIDVGFEEKRGLKKEEVQRHTSSSRPPVVCTLKLDITDICTVTAVGEASGKQAARQAAWLHAVSKMHVDGSLKDLFPSEDVSHAQTPAGEEVEDDDLQPVQVDENVIQQEKDAKTEIYEYAASLGLVPKFETKLRQLRTRAMREGNQRKPGFVYQAKIQLQSHNIDVSAIGKDLRSAEVAAALAFKAEAEKQHSKSGTSQLAQDRRILTVDNAKEFIAFYTNRIGQMNLSIEHEQNHEQGFNRNTAKLLLNGSQIGQEVSMARKAEAESVACLTAAVELTSTDPTLLREFEGSVTKGSERLLHPVKPIDITLRVDVADSMRDALVEARRAGLSDVRRTLGAETPNSRQRTFQPTRQLSPDQQSIHSEMLLKGQRSLERNPALQDSRLKKATLPMNHYRDRLLSMVTKNPYSIVVGATGSGKTTQVPQILFEDAINSGYGASCNIVCTQPRRIAATSVAQRVATERNEPLRKTVGHQVRFDSKPPYKPFGINYCTTGVLLEKLKQDPDDVLETVSHICIDEVHERDMQIDFLMIILKRTIKNRQAEGKSVPKIILMSATLDTKLFANYFSKVDDSGKLLPCPALSVPGRTFPVQEKYLDSIMDEMHNEHGSSQVADLLRLHSGTEEYMAAENAYSSNMKNESKSSRTGSVIDWKGKRQGPLDPAEAEAANEKEESLVPVALVAATIAHLCKTTEGGAILAFLPGLSEILETQKRLKDFSPLNLDFNDAGKYRVYPLHSTSTREQQAEIFNALEPGCRKIILSTNIAETSVTVSDVKYVVDSGKLRENRYDEMRRITKLQCVWVSKSNSKQRAGRAGRVQDGYYYALYSQERRQSLKAIGQPELLRSDLQETCLAVQAQKFDESTGSFLAQAIEPPTSQAISVAIQNLINIEALTSDENLTALGRVLSRLPVHPSLGKMIILGVIFRCLDPMITLGAFVNERSLFLAPVDARAEARRAQSTYAPYDQSDQLALLEAFQELRMLRHQYGIAASQQRARENFLHWGAFKMIDQSTKQIEQVLVDCGLIPLRTLDEQQISPACGPVSLNRNSQNSTLIKSLLVAGLSPNIGVKTSPNGIAYRTSREHSVVIYARSRNSEKNKGDPKHAQGTLFAYEALAKAITADSLLLRDTTKITPLMALLFGGRLRLDENGRLEIDEWLPLFVKYYDQRWAARLILEFRKALDRVLYRAFESLKDLTPEKGGQFAGDPVREAFVSKVVQILNMRDRFTEDAFRKWQDILRKEGI